jgi:indolepyruvate ferredoxin oxidoreductase alpha subunit
MFEPSDSQEAKDFMKLGFEVSEKFDTPVMLRGVTRISHSKGIVELKDPGPARPWRSETDDQVRAARHAKVKHGC